MAPSQAGSDKPQPAYEAMHLLLERIVAALGLEWSVLEDNKLLITICPQFAVALQESWTRVQTASLSWRRSRPCRETTPCMANQGNDANPAMDHVVAATVLADARIIDSSGPQLRPGTEKTPRRHLWCLSCHGSP